MNIPKDGPGASTSGSHTQEDVPHADGAPLPGQGNAPAGQTGLIAGAPRPAASPTIAMPPLSGGGQPAYQPAVAEHIEDPMAKLAQIIAQSPAAPVQVPTPESVAAPMASPVSQQPAVPLPPPPVAVPQIEIAAEDRPVAPVVQPSEKRFSLFRRKQVQNVAPTVGELTGAQTKKGFFARRAARREAEQVEQQGLKRTGRDKRYARRRRRVWFEELLGWVFVPVILVAIYYAALGVLAMMGTTPEAVIQGIKALRGH